MNTSKKNRKKLSKKVLCALAIGLMYCTVGSGYMKASPDNKPMEQQQAKVTVQGRIADSSGEPLIGVSVAVKGTTQGTITDVDGRYSINTTPDATLVFTYVGYHPQSVNVGNRRTIDIVMREDSQLMKEVVVVGFGVQKKENLTGAVASVDIEKALGSKPVSDVTKALQGITPGLTITYKSGNLNGDATINLRGVGTIKNNKEGGNPLVLIDGIPSDLTMINPEDVANISVLKDAASASIYGARGAFGVILITTKKGQSDGDKVKFSYSNNFGFSKPTTLVGFVDPEYELPVMMQASKRVKPGEMSESFGMYHDKLLAGIINWKEKYASSRTFDNKEMIYGEDWEIINGRAYTYRIWNPNKEMLKDWTPQQTHNLSAQGRMGQNSTFLISLGYTDQSGFMRIKTDKLKRYNANFSLNTQLTKWLKSDIGVLFTRKDYKEPFNYYNSSGTNLSGQNGYFGYYMRWGQYFPYGTYQGKYFRHAPGFMNAANMNNSQKDYLRLNAKLTADVTKDLQFIAEYSFGNEYSQQNINGHSVQLLNFWSGGWLPNDIIGSAYQDVAAPGSEYDKIALSSSKQQTHVLNAYGVYSKKILENHNIKVTAGTNIEQGEFQRFYSERRNVMDPNDINDIQLATGAQFTTSGWDDLKPKHNDYGIAGFFARVNYDYQGKYLLELNGRYDGSSRFPVGELWGFFPSASIGYRITEEPFMQNIKKITNDIKLRASVGSIGNQDVAANAFRAMMDIQNTDWIVGGTLAPSVKTPAIVDPLITWETIVSYDVGMDVRFLNNMFGLTFDWYQRNNKNMLAIEKELPQAIGTSAPWTNSGDMRTRGYEIGIDFNYPINKDISIYATASLSDYQSEIVKWSNPSKSLGQYYEGMKIGEIWGFETDRLFQKDDFNSDGTYKEGIASQSLLVEGTFKFGPGDVKYKNLDDDNTKISIGSATADDHGDLKVIGNTTPRYQYSFRLGGNFYGFDIDAFFQGVGKRDYWANSDLVLPLYSRTDALYEKQMDYWREDNPNAFYPNPWVKHDGDRFLTTSGKSLTGLYGSNNFVTQSRYLLNMSYLRLKNVTVGYTLPTALTQKAKLDKVRIYFSGQNLAEIKSDRLPVDPEINDTEAVWGRTYPYPRTFSLGLQVNF